MQQCIACMCVKRSWDSVIYIIRMLFTKEREYDGVFTTVTEMDAVININN